MGNSTVRLRDALDYAQSFPDVASVFPAAGYSAKRAMQVANAVMQKFLSSSLKWPWNRQSMAMFVTNSWQQDYATANVNASFLFDSTMLEINNSQVPQPVWTLEVVQGLPVVSAQYGRPGQINLLYNRDLRYAKWGAAGAVGSSYNVNPQPLQAIVNPVGLQVTPSNPWCQVVDPNGNFWVVTTYGTTGATQPAWPTTPVFPTFLIPTTVATTITDGSVVWTACNPVGFGFRLSPLPPQTGVPYQVWPVWQMRPPMFTSITQSIDPVPDDYSQFYMDGYVAHLYGMVADPKIRAKHIDAVAIWEKSLKDAKIASDRTRDQAVAYPSESIMSGGDSWGPNPAHPFGPNF